MRHSAESQPGKKDLECQSRKDAGDPILSKLSTRPHRRHFQKVLSRRLRSSSAHLKKFRRQAPDVGEHSLAAFVVPRRHVGAGRGRRESVRPTSGWASPPFLLSPQRTRSAPRAFPFRRSGKATRAPGQRCRVRVPSHGDRTCRRRGVRPSGSRSSPAAPPRDICRQLPRLCLLWQQWSSHRCRPGVEEGCRARFPPMCAFFASLPAFWKEWCIARGCWFMFAAICGI